MKNKVFLFIILILLSSCNWYSDCTKVEVSEELKEWSKAYNLDDTIVLKSNFNNYDSLLVTSIKSKYSPCNKFELGPNVYETLSLKLKSISISTELDTCKKQLKKEGSTLILSSRRNYDKEFIGVNTYNLHFANSACERKNSDSIINCDKLVCLKIPYFKDSIFAYKYDTMNARFFYHYINSEYPCAIKSFHWSKEHGLVQYETEEDEIYRLIKK